MMATTARCPRCWPDDAEFVGAVRRDGSLSRDLLPDHRRYLHADERPGQPRSGLKSCSPAAKSACQIAGGIPTLYFQAGILPEMQKTHRRDARGGDRCLAGLCPCFADQRAQHHQVADLCPVERLCLARGGAGRNATRRRHGCCAIPTGGRGRGKAGTPRPGIIRPLKNPQELLLLDSENGTGPIGGTLKEFADSAWASTAAMRWPTGSWRTALLSTVHMAPFPKDEELTMELMSDPKTVGNISDAGAHLQMLCGGGENALLLTRYVRDDKMMTIEEAVHVMTGKLAEHFFLQRSRRDRAGQTRGHHRVQSGRSRPTSRSKRPGTCPTARAAPPGASPASRRRCG